MFGENSGPAMALNLPDYMKGRAAGDLEEIEKEKALLSKKKLDSLDIRTTSSQIRPGYLMTSLGV